VTDGLDAGCRLPYDRATLPPWGGGQEPDISKEAVALNKNDNTLRRLKTVEGHLRGVIRMIEGEAYCIDVIRQIQAIGSALNKVSTQILENHLDSCVTTAIQGNNARERERVLREITEVFEMSMKV
jgi:DNA-binding FrmR family transcriptional regulator